MDHRLVLKMEAPRKTLDADMASWGSNADVRELKPMPVKTGGLKEASFAEPVSALITVGALMLGKRIVEHWLAGRENGLQIDLRTTPPTMTRLSNVPRGFVVTIDAEGKATSQKVAYEKGEDLGAVLTTVLGAAKG